MINDKIVLDITAFIPTGHSHAVNRKELRIMTGLPDRLIRKYIHKARRHTVILNIQDGGGYFIPDMEDAVDREALRQYVRQEENRLKSIGWALKPARALLREVDKPAA